MLQLYTWLQPRAMLLVLCCCAKLDM